MSISLLICVLVIAIQHLRNEASKQLRSPRTFVRREKRRRRHGMAASNILSWRMIASLTLIYRPSKVSLPLDSPHEGPIGRTNERTNNAPIIGRRRAEEEEGGERIRDSWRRRRPNLRAKRINDGRIEDRGRRIPTLLAGGRAR